MKKFLLICSVFICSIAHAQSIIDTSNVWNVLSKTGGGGGTTIYKCKGDTLLHSQNWRKIFASDDSGRTTNYLAALHEDTLHKRVYVNYIQDTTTYLLYDFNLHLHDTLNYQYHETLTVMGIDSVTLNDSTKRKRLLIQSTGGEQEYWIESIGSTRGLLYAGKVIFDGETQLLCFKSHQQTLLNTPGKDCYVSVASITEIQQQQYSWNLYPNPVQQSGILHTDTPVQHPRQLAIYNTFGQLILNRPNILQSDISLSRQQVPAPGLYFFVLTEAGTQIAHGKIVFE